MAEEKKEAPKKSLNMALIGTLALAVVNLAVMGGGTFLIYKNTLGWVPLKVTEEELREKSLSERVSDIEKAEGKGEAARAPASAESPGHGDQAKKDDHGGGASGFGGEVPMPLVTKLEKFKVNLGGVPSGIIQVEMSLEMLDPNSFEEVMDPVRIPKIRDQINHILGSTEFTDIESIQGKLFLKDKIVRQVNSILDKGSVRDVYFSEFIVSR